MPLARLLPLILALILALTSSCPGHTRDARDRSVEPLSSISVFWVGHSLVESKAHTPAGPIDLMSQVDQFARARGLSYAMGDHTLWGSALSALWRGRPHGHQRDATAMIPKREAFVRDAARYDTLVATELLSIRSSLAFEFSPYYLRQFYCTLKRANPQGRVFLYQTWVNLQGASSEKDVPPPDRYDWRKQMLAQRADFETLADLAVSKRVTAPGPFGSRWFTTSTDAGCSDEDPILLVPVGNVLVEIHDRIARSRPGDYLVLPNGSPLRMTDLFANPYTDWPQDWPLPDSAYPTDAKAVLAKLKPRDPSKPHDDIHPSALGIYIAAVVHFATLYRQSPVGLPHPVDIGPEVARTLQCIAWETVLRDPRTGLSGNAGC